MSSSENPWRKSSYSSQSGGACIEVATASGKRITEMNSAWRKSSYSGGSTGNCVEVGSAGAVLVRDTTDRGGFTLTVPAAAWSVFLATVR